MKNFRLIAPMVAFLFAVVGAFASANLVDVTAYYGTTSSCSPSTAPDGCQVQESGNLCTISGTNGNGQAALNDGCFVQLKRTP